METVKVKISSDFIMQAAEQTEEHKQKFVKNDKAAAKKIDAMLQNKNIKHAMQLLADA